MKHDRLFMVQMTGNKRTKFTFDHDGSVIGKPNGTGLFGRQSFVSPETMRCQWPCGRMEKKNGKKFVQKRRNEVFSVVDIMGGEFQWTCLNEMKCFRTNTLPSKPEMPLHVCLFKFSGCTLVVKKRQEGLFQ